MKIAIIILHYGSIEDTKECLDSVFMLKKDNLNVHIILVDNSANFPDWLSENQSRDFQVIQNSKNLGFAAGVNVGIKEALKNSSDYILVLNNDVILPSDFLVNILKKSADITAPVIKFKWEDKWIYDFGGKINFWTGRTTHLEFNNDTMKQFNNEETVDYVSGCCMLIKRKVFEKIGLFDERYYFYFEDADFCIKAKRENFTISVNPQVTIFHKMGGAVGRWSNRAIYYNLIGNLKFIMKNSGARQPVGYAYIMVLSAKILLDKIFGQHQI